MKKLSVKTKYALILAAILAVLIGLQLLFNQVFMERFYLNRKLELVKELRSVTLEYIETCKNGENTDAQEMELRKSCEAAGAVGAGVRASADRASPLRPGRTG